MVHHHEWGGGKPLRILVDLKNRPGWAQYLAQKLNVMIVTIPGNFKYGGWQQPIADVPARVLVGVLQLVVMLLVLVVEIGEGELMERAAELGHDKEYWPVLIKAIEDGAKG